MTVKGISLTINHCDFYIFLYICVIYKYITYVFIYVIYIIICICNIHFLYICEGNIGETVEQEELLCNEVETKKI